MREARRESVRELIRPLEMVQLRSQARCEEDNTFEARPFSSTEGGVGTTRKV